MCDLIRGTRKKKVIGWKIVAVHKKTKEYYSIAMGCKYPKKGKVPIVRVMKPTCSGFASITGRNIREYWEKYHNRSKFGGFRINMVGRTAIFKRKTDAKSQLEHISPNNSNYIIKIKKAEVSENLLEGVYNHRPVCAGEHIKFLD